VRVRICSVSDALCRRSSPAAVLIYLARPVWYRVQIGAACPAVGRVCRCAVCPGTCPALVLVRPALLSAVCSPSGCAGVCRGAPAGYTATAQPRPVSLPTTEKIKKTHPILTKRNVCHCAIFQIFRKIQKDPSPGLICVILDRKKGAL